MTPREGDGTTDADPPLRCLVTGATGYIGGRLVPELPAAGYSVRCLVRSPGQLRDHPWAGEAGARVEVVRGDVTDERSVGAAMEGTDIAYYLVHALVLWPGRCAGRLAVSGAGGPSHAFGAVGEHRRAEHRPRTGCTRVMRQRGGGGFSRGGGTSRSSAAERGGEAERGGAVPGVASR